MLNHEKHIKSTRATKLNGKKWEVITYCGETLTNMEFVFSDAEHAINTILSSSYLTPCEKCRQKLLEILI